MTGRTGLVAVLALVLATLVVRGAAIGALSDTRPDLALKIAPGDPTSLIAASGYVAQVDTPPTPAQSAMLLRAAAGDPLYPEPYLASAVAASAYARGDRTIALAQAARARDPRVLATNALLLREYARAGDLPAAVATMNTLAALSGDVGPALAASLSKLADDPQGSRVIAAALHQNPHWRTFFVRQANGPGQSLAFQTLIRTPAGISDAETRQDRSSFLSQLVQAGKYQQAYLAWVNFLPPAQTGNVTAIYDGDFRGLPGLEPFNWSLIENEAATAERRSDSSLPGHRALDVNFFGNNPASIANQTLLVAPGSYHFSLIGEVDAGGTFPGQLRWQLTCLPSQSAIPLATINRFDGKPFRFSRPVVIPARGCIAQQLTLLGEPGEVATLIHAQFTAVAMVPR